MRISDWSSDVCSSDLLEQLWPLCEKVARRLKKAGLAGCAVHLKLKTSDFKLVSRSRRLVGPTQMAEELYRAASPLLTQEADSRRYRLVGVGVAELVSAAPARSAERRGGKECVRTLRSRWSPLH